MRTIIPKKAHLLPNEAKLVFKGVFFDVYQWPQKMFDGSYKTFEMLKRPDSVMTIPIKDNKIILTQEEQPGHEVFIDFLGGRHDNEKETELEAAKRELREETGLYFKDWKLVAAFQPSLHIDRLIYVYTAHNYVKQEQSSADNGEKIKLITCDYEKALIMLKSPESRASKQEINVLEAAGSIEGLLGLPEYKA